MQEKGASHNQVFVRTQINHIGTQLTVEKILLESGSYGVTTFLRQMPQYN